MIEMKKTIAIVAVLLAMAGNTLAGNKLTAETVKKNAGETSELVISMENDIEVGAYDFHLYLPKGIALIYDEVEKDYLYELSSRHNKKHQATIMYDETDDSFMFGVADPSLHKLKDNSGEILRVQLMATEEVADGEQIGSIRKIWFAESGTSGVEVADVTFVIDAVNGINDVLMDKDSSKYYTIDGRRIGKPSKKGLYIKGNRKVIVR